MARQYRPPRRLFASEVAELAREALRGRNPNWPSDWPSEPKEQHHFVTRLWRRTLTRWENEDPQAFSPRKWQQMRDCPSSIYWTPKLVRSGNHRPAARFCRETWNCPFCYGREIVRFLRPFERRQFCVHTIIDRQFRDAEEAWQYSQEVGRQLLAERGGFACWRFTYPLPSFVPYQPDIWVLQATWLYPGTDTLHQNANALLEGLAYPLGLLNGDVPLAEFLATRQFMQHCQGRCRRGCYRGSAHDSPED